MKKHCCVSLSGGMDSSTLLLRALSEYDSVTALSFDYGQKHRVELERAASLVDYLNDHCMIADDQLFPRINYRVIKLEGLPDLLNSSLVTGGKDVPEGHYAQENMKETVVPNRNKIFSSIVQAVALSIATKNGESCDIALGIHAGDHSIYPDCRQEFRDADELAFKLGNWDSELVNYYTPYLETDKYGILKDGSRLCGDLLLDFNQVYKKTNTSYKPLKIGDKWYSDYKSASSVERIEAFMRLGKKDPVEYADENGPVSWDVVVKHTEKVLSEFNG